MRYKYPFMHSNKDPLMPRDTENQTDGCRVWDPEFCKGAGLKTCAFNNDEHICYTPRGTWKKVYKKLLEANKMIKK